jgi:hypothetical protein
MSSEAQRQHKVIGRLFSKNMASRLELEDVETVVIVDERNYSDYPNLIHWNVIGLVVLE